MPIPKIYSETPADEIDVEAEIERLSDSQIELTFSGDRYAVKVVIDQEAWDRLVSKVAQERKTS